ncbi:MAG: class I SAM-dependent methyltransferase [Rhizobiaceae bacterium]|nr:class I SAM-dependent methyltransferase [Rhizobiaceae bacterium]
MISDRLKTLLYPLGQEILALPGDGRVLFVGAESGLAEYAGLAGMDVTCVQGFRPTFLALAAEGWKTLPEPEGEDYDAALVLAGRHRRQNEAWIAEALRRVRPEGLVLVGGAKTDGIASLRKHIAEFLPEAGHASKHHGLVSWLRKDGSAERYIDDISQENQKAVALAGGLAPDRSAAFETAPGMFSHGHVDAGSALLVQCLPADLSGRAADFCAGWGYLSVALALRALDIKGIDLYEADHASLEAARRNMAALASDMPARFFWHDLVNEPVRDRYDLIVMNPPFHTGRAAEPALGEALIRVAARSLGPGGQLYMVANRQLPYEAALAQAFSCVEKLREEQGFKVFRARR